VPVDSKTLAIICDDPDAPKGLWVHWVAFNLPATITEVKASGDVLAHGGTVGTNSWDKQSWGGPCPPSGTHRYYFKVYALDTKLTLDKTARNTDLLRAMEGHIIGYGELMGLYAKKK
jgi:Raf kinase inhibitor-like YbhB/YbcL family protein